jgi:putative glutamine amidotransferase
MKPRIAIPLPTSTDLAYNQASWRQYAAAVQRSGGEAVAIPLHRSPTEIANLINTCRAVLLPGSPADVNPHKYAQERIPECAPPDNPRENVDELLLQDAHNLYKPILAICFGLQSLNVWRGGTLIQDLTILPVNHSAGSSVAIAHSVAVAPGSLFSALLSQQEAPEQQGYPRLPVNSSHHQAIGVPGDGLRVSARCPQDAVIEAVEGGQATEGTGIHFVVGVQWHPERSYDISATSQALFQRFVAEASVWTPRPIHTSVG